MIPIPTHSPLKTLAALGGVVLFVCAAVARAAEPSDLEFFHAKVEPVLRANCYKCHSHDAGKMKGGLTLDSKSGWAQGGDSGAAVVPGDPDKSLLVNAVRYADPDLEMPPKKKLADDEIAILVEWIRRGAVDPRKAESPKPLDSDWWSLKKLVAPKVPGEGHPIDAFIRKRLSDSGHQPAKQADRVTLVRRLYVDLHGYLPTPQEVQRFNDDPDPQAYAKLVDARLASPRYGERWARHWLDVVHYADSHGCEHDVKRPNAWRYRDYVIDRLNADVPWDRFIREQLATDVFYADQPQLTPALGFISAGPQELSRAGTAPVTFDYLDRDDIVTQTMAAFVSTTANCARCHTHKFDPITQEDYYALQAVFAGVGKGDIEYDTSAATMARRKELEALVDAAGKGDANVLLQPKHAEIVRRWAVAHVNETVKWETLDPEVFVAAGGAVLTKQKDMSIFATGKTPQREIYTVSGGVNVKHLTAVRLEVMKDERLPKGGPGRAGNGNMHLTDAALQWFPEGSDTPVQLMISRATADFNQNGWVAAHAIDGDDGTGWAIYPKVNASHHIVFELAAPVDTAGGGRLAVTLKQLPPTHHIGRFRISVTNAEAGAAQVLPAAVTRGLTKPEAQRTKAEAVAIAAAALENHAKAQLRSLPKRPVTYGVSSSWSHAKKLPAPQQPKIVHLLRRGDIDKPMREVGPGSLSVIDALPGRFELPNPNDEAARRAALADWLAHRDNPFTWRSVVNRVWHYHFGRGLVDTPNDFGRMGSEPTHPELLDWLAVWFRDEAKGSLKQLHRLILTSETWKQSSVAAVHPNDADNRLLWRMNRLRMDAGVYRDSVLRMAGRLDLKMGGPGIEQFKKSKGPQATPALDYTAYDWESPGANRRSIYRVVWRGIPDPFMEALDFPDLGLLAPKRGRSLSALQSLAIYNNRFVLHGSESFAKRIQREHEAVDAQIARAVQLAWLRSPSNDELAKFAGYVDKHGLAALCRVLLNSNEFLFVE